MEPEYWACNIGPEGAIPVMEGKSVLFKVLGGINAFPLCIDMKDKEEIIRFVKAIQPVFGAINIEDIESPKVLEIVEGCTKIFKYQSSTTISMVQL